MKFFEKIRNSIKMQRLPIAYEQRTSDEAAWKEAYPSDFETAEKTLKVFCSAFLLPYDERFKFRPDDKINDIYKAIYPSKWTPDTLEHAFLIKGIEKEFKLHLNNHELERIETLNDLIEKAKAAQPKFQADS